MPRPAKHTLLRQTMLAAAVSAAFAAAPAAAFAQQAPLAGRQSANAETLPRITVEASGAASAKPDMAELQISITQDGKNAKSAVEKVNQSMKPLLAALKAILPEKDIQSSGFSVDSVYPQENDRRGGAKAERSFRASSRLLLKLRDTKQLGAVIDTALTNGATDIDDLSWTNSNLKALYAEARQNAVAEALAKTKAYAKAAGVSAGRILKIEESGGDAAPRFFARAAAAPIMADTAIAEGENSYTARIRMTTELVNKAE